MILTIYILFCLMALFCAAMVVITSHAVYSALYLVFTMIAIAGLFILMNAQLAAALQIIVYAGAIMVLFIFVIMLLNLGKQEAPEIHNKNVRGLGILFGLAFVVQAVALMSAMPSRDASYTLANARDMTINEVARRLITDYVYAFEMTSVLLLVAVVGAVVLARRRLIQGTEIVKD